MAKNPLLTPYPFSALVGQEAMQMALLLNAVNPSIGGVLIRGQKGTAKSTAARALAHLMTPLDATDVKILLKGRRFEDVIDFVRPPGPPPFVELPLGATDDRVTGALDVEAILQGESHHFEPGLLAKVHGGVLYVDEVNLLADHIVDLLLDVVVSGLNTVEREGVSVSHVSRFILIGTMNPEEGELRPQFLDRFGLAVEVSGQRDPTQRAEVVRRRIAYEAEPEAFSSQYTAAEDVLSQKIKDARHRLDSVKLNDEMLNLITYIGAGSGVDGLRADITMYKTARTLAAWHGRPAVNVADVKQAAELVLLHRRRRQPFEDTSLDNQHLDQLIHEFQNQHPEHPRESQQDDTSEGE